MFWKVHIRNECEPVGGVGRCQGDGCDGREERKGSPRIGENAAEYFTGKRQGAGALRDIETAQRNPEEDKEERDSAKDAGGAEQCSTAG